MTQPFDNLGTTPVVHPIRQLLSRHRPRLAERLQAEPCSEGIQVALEDDELICCLLSGQAIDVPALRNRVDHKILETIRLSDPIIVCPSGFGHLFWKMRTEAAPGTRWILVEPFAYLFRASLRHEGWWSEVLPDCFVKLFIGPGATEACLEWARRHAVVFSRDPALIVGRKITPDETEAMSHFTGGMKDLVATARNTVKTTHSDLSKHYRSSRKRDRVLLLEPDHFYLASAIVRGIQNAGYVGILSGRGRRLADVMGRNKEFMYINDERPDLILVIHHNPLPPGAGELLKEFGIPVVIWYLDHPLVVRPIVKDPGLFTRAYVFDENYNEMLLELGHREARVLPIAAFLPLCEDWVEEGVTDERYGVTFVGGAVGRQYLNLRDRWSNECPERLAVLDELVEQAIDGSLEDRWATGVGLAPRLEDHGIKFDNEILSYILQGVSYERRLRFLTATAPLGLSLFGGQWDNPAVCGQLTRYAVGGRLKYGAELARVYRHSAININILDAMMVDSINLRSVDVMAAGGFLLSEYRPAYDRTFKIGKELDCFRTLEELCEKIEYYLRHPDERREIAQRGRNRVLSEHTITHRMRDLLAGELS